MRRSTVIAVAAAVLLAGAGFLIWRHLEALGEQMTGLQRQAEEASVRASAAESRAAEAEAKAERAEREAGAAARQAEEANVRERQTAEQARQAQADREIALEKERLSAEARLEAERQARQEAERRTLAERLRAEADAEAAAAREEARQARLEKERLQRRMEAELDRLQRSLGRIADTRRTALGLVMTLDSRQIEFDFDKAELRPRNREILSQIAGVLLTFDNYGVQVFGHTDDVGGVEYNRELSKRRAEAVRDYLVEAGIDPEVLSTTGMGKSSPRVEGTDAEARQRNRRVELAIVFSEGEYEALSEDEG